MLPPRQLDQFVDQPQRLLAFVAALLLTGVGLILAVAGLVWPPVIPAAPVPTHPYALGPSINERKVSSTIPVVRPNELSISSIGVAANVEPADVVNGRLLVTNDAAHVSQWRGGSTVTSLVGTILLAGHVNFARQGPGAMARLAFVHRDARIELSDRRGHVSLWRAAALGTYAKSDLPRSLFSTTGQHRLVLVTCGGPYDRATHHYLFNVVLVALPVTHS